eukprot:403364552
MFRMPQMREMFERDRAESTQRAATKKFNSDWNTVLPDDDKNIFFKVLQASQRTCKQMAAPQATKMKQRQQLKLIKRIRQQKQEQQEEKAQTQTHGDGKNLEADQNMGTSSSSQTTPNTQSADQNVKVIDYIDTNEIPILDQKAMASRNAEEEKKEQAQKTTALIDDLKLRQERLQRFTMTEDAEFYQSILPNTLYKQYNASDSRVYGGKFTSRGNLYYSSSQSHVILFNTSDPYNWTLKKQIMAREVSWTVTDMDVCENEQYLIYSTINSVVQLVDLDTLSKRSERIIFNERSHDGWYGGSGIMSIKFSGDSREILAGTKNAEIMVYDLISNRVSTKVTSSHDDEINSVCFANRMQSNIIFTGSDDSLIKIWDRRALGNNREAGAFVGHCEGVTHVASKGDGIYMASNGKDQLLKVWDLRKMVSADRLRNISKPRGYPGYDYRWQQPYPWADRQVRHTEDTSIFTFKGHHVLQTLIRCQFSPQATTGQRYVYTGSADGIVRIYDMLTGEEAMSLQSPKVRDCARDISWHPHYPILASTCFSGKVNLWTPQNKEKQAASGLTRGQSQQDTASQVPLSSRYNSMYVDDDEDEADGSGALLQQLLARTRSNGASAATGSSLLDLLFRQIRMQTSTRSAAQNDSENEGSDRDNYLQDDGAGMNADSDGIDDDNYDEDVGVPRDEDDDNNDVNADDEDDQ